MKLLGIVCANPHRGCRDSIQPSLILRRSLSKKDCRSFIGWLNSAVAAVWFSSRMVGRMKKPQTGAPHSLPGFLTAHNQVRLFGPDGSFDKLGEYPVIPHEPGDSPASESDRRGGFLDDDHAFALEELTGRFDVCRRVTQVIDSASLFDCGIELALRSIGRHQLDQYRVSWKSEELDEGGLDRVVDDPPSSSHPRRRR